jgi:hypothetical protein
MVSPYLRNGVERFYIISLVLESIQTSGRLKFSNKKTNLIASLLLPEVNSKLKLNLAF